jgi:hypothetical protein
MERNLEKRLKGNENNHNVINRDIKNDDGLHQQHHQHNHTPNLCN